MIQAPTNLLCWLFIPAIKIVLPTLACSCYTEDNLDSSVRDPTSEMSKHATPLHTNVSASKFKGQAVTQPKGLTCLL